MTWCHFGIKLDENIYENRNGGGNEDGEYKYDVCLGD